MKKALGSVMTGLMLMCGVHGSVSAAKPGLTVDEYIECGIFFGMQDAIDEYFWMCVAPWNPACNLAACTEYVDISIAECALCLISGFDENADVAEARCGNEAEDLCEFHLEDTPFKVDPGEVAPVEEGPNRFVPSWGLPAPRVIAPVEKQPAPFRGPSYNFNAGNRFQVR